MADKDKSDEDKYEALYEYLEKRYANSVVLTFAQIEDLLGFPLADSARLPAVSLMRIWDVQVRAHSGEVAPDDESSVSMFALHSRRRVAVETFRTWDAGRRVAPDAGR